VVNIDDKDRMKELSSFIVTMVTEKPMLFGIVTRKSIAS